MRQCQYRLLGVWLAGAGLLGAILVVQQMRGYYGADAQAAWAWFSPNVVPTVSLMVAVVVAAQQQHEDRQVDRAFYRMTLAASVIFLLLLFATVLAQPFTDSTPLELMQGSTLYLAIFQAFAAGMLGAFFIKKGE